MRLLSLFNRNNKTLYKHYIGGIKIANACDIPEEIPNMQLCYIAAYLRDFHFSVIKSQSADQGDGFVIEADMIRLKDRISDLHVQWDFLASLPLLDTPETHGCLVYAYPPLDDLPTPENKDVQLITNMVAMMHFEFGVSQSARLQTGIQVHDYDRGVTYMENMSKLIDEYITQRTPNDWPKSSPEEGRVGPGRTGV